jgi:hypothetical protein
MHPYLIVRALLESKGIRMPEALSGLETEPTSRVASGCANNAVWQILIAGFGYATRATRNCRWAPPSYNYFSDYSNLYPRRVSSRAPVRARCAEHSETRASRDWLIPIGPIGSMPSFVRAFE